MDRAAVGVDHRHGGLPDSLFVLCNSFYPTERRQVSGGCRATCEKIGTSDFSAMAFSSAECCIT
jgi:hypothetical protein